ncbi:MAG: glycosyltransferase [Brumimicrobium sp.]
MGHKNRVIVSVTNDLYTDQRVHKVCLFLHEKGHDVLLVGRKRRNSIDLERRDYKTKRIKLLFEKGALFYAFYNLRLFVFLLFNKSDVLLSNDLDTLLANYLASKVKGSKLVYDTHELFTEVPELVSRPKVRKIWLKIEGWMFPKLKHVYTVNQSIADIYMKRYNTHVSVVRNVSPKWESSNISTKKELGLPENKTIIILQGAGINVDRGAEEAIEAMKSVDCAVLIIVGDGDVVPTLKQNVKTQSLEDKVIFYGKKPYNKLMEYTFHADIGLTLDKDTNPNYKYSLPNKVFDYIHAETPIISSNLIEIKRIVERHDVGIVLGEHSSKAISKAINNYIEHPDILLQKKKNCKKAANVECWENEKKVLEEIYMSI